MARSIDLSAHGRLIALGALALVLAAAAAAPQWLIRAARAVHDGFFELFLAGWLC
jgi:hypothetical protein